MDAQDSMNIIGNLATGTILSSYVKIEIVQQIHRDNMVTALAHNGYKVWVEEEEQADRVYDKYYVCFELKGKSEPEPVTLDVLEHRANERRIKLQEADKRLEQDLMDADDHQDQE